MTGRDKARAVRLYRSGHTLREIAERLGVDQRTIWRVLQGRVESRRVGPRGRTDVTDAEIVESREVDQLSWSEIAEQTGMSRTGVRTRYLMATSGQRWR